MVEIKKIHEFENNPTPLDFEAVSTTKGYIKDLLEVEPCPNCGKDMVSGKCSDSKMCGYGHGEDYFLEKIELKRHLSETLKGNGEKYELITINGKKFCYFDFHGRIKENTAILDLEIDGKKYKVEVLYEISNKDEIKNISSISIVGDIKTQLKSKKWKKIYFEYRELKRYIFAVLTDYRFNKFLREE